MIPVRTFGNNACICKIGNIKSTIHIFASEYEGAHGQDVLYNIANKDFKVDEILVYIGSEDEIPEELYTWQPITPQYTPEIFDKKFIGSNLFHIDTIAGWVRVIIEGDITKAYKTLMTFLNS